MIKAEIIADSLNKFGNRITTFVITFPRIVLAEFNTHRMFSRNSASSRAIPFKKMVEAVEKNPFIPLKWMKDHRGMQGTEFFNEEESKLLTQCWLSGRDSAVANAKMLHFGIGRKNENGEIISHDPVTKQICNRQLEAYMWHTAIVTSTEWENYFSLRAHEGADIHIQKLAEEMLYALNESQPKQLRPGEWHIPFGDCIELPSPLPIESGLTLKQGVDLAKVKVSTARCAQISYTLIGEDGKAMDFFKLVGLHDRLSNAGHWSPFEHPGRSMTWQEYLDHTRSFTMPFSEFGDYQNNNEPKSYKFQFIDSNKVLITEFGWCGNFRGYIQYRKMFANENRRDSRLVKAT
jgi:hypothetical protein